MGDDSQAARFESVEPVETAAATVLVGLPGLGLAGVIATEHVTDDLGLSYHGRLVSERFPQVATFDDGLYRAPIRVYGDADSHAITVQADLIFPPRSHRALASGIVETLTEDCELVVVPIGAPVETVDGHGDVTAIATTGELRDELEAAGVRSAPGVGSIGGPTGALLTACAHAEVPAVALVVGVEPYRPDPSAAEALISEGLQPVADIDVDTGALRRRGEELEAELAEMARLMQRMEVQEGLDPVPAESEPSMFQ